MEPKLAGSLGFEPRLAESKATVLPLDELPICYDVYGADGGCSAEGTIELPSGRGTSQSF